MKEIDTKVEVFQAAKAASLTFGHLDLVMDAPNGTGGNAMVKGNEDLFQRNRF